MAIFLIPFAAISLGWRPIETFGQQRYALFYAIWMLFFTALNLAWIFTTIRSHKKLQDRERAANTERLPRYKKALEEGAKVVGTRWTSSGRLFGLPLVQIAFPDFEVGISDETVAQQGTARAWIAIGRFAYGRLFALGDRAIAPVAIGNKALGIVSCGVFSAGVVSLGVLTVAPLSIGVIAIGWLCAGGAVAAGAFAVAPMAFGFTAAKGAMVFSFRFADGPVAFARHANDDVARQYLESSPVLQQFDDSLRYIATSSTTLNVPYLIVGVIALSIVVQQIARRRR